MTRVLLVPSPRLAGHLLLAPTAPAARTRLRPVFQLPKSFSTSRISALPKPSPISPSPSTSLKSPRPKPYFVTTPIFYVNADPHIGHLYSDVIADVLARYHNYARSGYSRFDTTGASVDETRLQLKTSSQGPVKSFLCTGTDEHGLKIQKVAEAAGEDPQHLCDRISQRFQQLADAANIEYTSFIRTTDPEHKEAVHHLWKTMEGRGFIYKGSHEGWYAVSDEAFYPEGQVHEVVDPATGTKQMQAVETGAKVEWSSEENYKFRLSAFRDQLVAWLESNPNAIRPAQKHAEVLAEIKSGLEDLSISRPSSRLSWGIPVPNDPEHSIYVWVDALTNYLTVTGYPWSKQGQEDSATQIAWPADVHVVGKDIIRFHSIFWPAFLMAAGLPLPRTVLAHAHWTMNKAKMSKSRGNVANPFDAINTFGLDALRFFLMRVGGNFASDSDYNPATLLEFHRKYLQGQLGNLVSRISSPKIHARLAELHSDVNKIIPRPSAQEIEALLDENTRQLAQALESNLIALPGKVDALMDAFEVSKAIELVIEDTIGQTNEFVQRVQPWAATTPTRAVLESVILVTESLRICASLLSPIMPQKMSELLDSLQIDPERRNDYRHLVQLDINQRLVSHVRLRDPSQPKLKPLFPRLEVEA
ncbi:putative METHIONYL-TRNA SYNTHETASE, mitochondrial [Testicularia cyperi]|uniref:Probable methionine--tRNA ligase, mitochondrial n=1 Tax=Testicularia cyperi TaxID=1882483 RepID=A0A317XV91_9BASI|nr:putative METHIONYL-TRNA SYNTHETASE, mitochondrial [Testicularia cyperi]